MNRQSILILTNLIIWVAVIVATSIVLHGTPYLAKMIPVVGGGAAVSLVVLSGRIRKQ